MYILDIKLNYGSVIPLVMCDKDSMARQENSPILRTIKLEVFSDEAEKESIKVSPRRTGLACISLPSDCPNSGPRDKSSCQTSFGKGD